MYSINRGILSICCIWLSIQLVNQVFLCPLRASCRHQFPTMDQAGDDARADLIMYQRLLGKLMYLGCGARPDIAFVVGQLSWHNSDPRAGHLRIAKQVLIYLKGTITLGIMWGGDPADHLNKYQPLGVVGYNNFAGDANDRKSVTWYCFFIGGAITTWCSKRQRTVSPSTSEAEDVAMSHGAREGVWIDDS